MKLQFWSVGKPHDAYVKEGIEAFTKRIQNYFSCEWKIVTPPKQAATLSANELKKAEAASLLSLLQQDDCLLLLDEKGKELSSPELAQWIQQRANESSKRVILLIGGAFGVDESISKRANYTWSLSRLVFPHMLVRLILAEQVYRACTILRNEKYHHS